LTAAGVSLNGRRILILGSGGAARAIAFAVATGTIGSSVTILGILEKERQELVSHLKERTALHVEEGPLTERSLQRALHGSEIVIHCTPVGMHPGIEDTCVPANLLGPHLTVMDIVYNPRETRLLREAKGAGCRIIHGLEMFLNQAVAQFELWTGQPAPADVMRSVLESRFV
jgi:shikimate dehydrogenase